MTRSLAWGPSCFLFMIQQQVDAPECGGPGAAHDQLDLRHILAENLQPVQEGRSDDDRRAVLIVVKDRNLHALAQFPLHEEAFRRR